MIRIVDDQNQRQQRLQIVEGLQLQGTSLLLAATEGSLKTRARLALLDLENAKHWLTQDAIVLKPELLQLVDNTIDLATRNLAIVAKALDDLRSNSTG
jgi:hypothetical protein